jgi:hypothetical protein
VIDLLIGKDVPGTIATVKVARAGVAEPFEVSLKRASTADLAEKKKMFELFTVLRDKAMHAKHDDGSVKVIDQVIELWGKMMQMQQEHDDKIVAKVQKMQGDADSAVRNLQVLLGKVHAVSCEQQAAIAQLPAASLLSVEKRDAGRVRLGAGAPDAGGARGLPLPVPGGPGPAADGEARMCGVGVVFAQVDVRTRATSGDAHNGKPFVSSVVPGGPADGAVCVDDELLEVCLHAYIPTQRRASTAILLPGAGRCPTD